MEPIIASKNRTLIVGLGVTGLSVARYLAKQGQSFMVADSRLDPPMLSQFQQQFPDTKILLGPLTFSHWQGISEIVLSPGLPRTEPAIVEAIAAGLSVVGDIELFARAVRAPVVAITGSNGKTTVTTLLGLMALKAGFQSGVGGNLGVPALDLLDDAAQLYVLELSSFQLESINKLTAKAATVLNVTADHMDRYANLHDYKLAKQKVYADTSLVVFNRDDLLTQSLFAGSTASISFGLDEPGLNDYGLRTDSDGVVCLARGLRTLMPMDELKIRGRHNVQNALAALALAEAVDIPEQAALDALREFAGIEHRCQFVGECNGVEYFNDSKATNVGATQAAITGLGANGKKIVLVAGGDGEGADFSPLAPLFEQHLRALIAIGRDGEKLAKLSFDKMETRSCGTLAEAVIAAKDLAQSGDIVLLSPACASFDMFENYEDRGRQFVEQVEALC